MNGLGRQKMADKKDDPYEGDVIGNEKGVPQTGSLYFCLYYQI